MTASSEASAKSEALELFSGPENARPKAQLLLELIAADDFEGALRHNASVAKEMSTDAAVEDWFLNRFEEWGELALVKAKEDWAREKAKAKAPTYRRVVDPGRWGPRPTQNAGGPPNEAALKVFGKADFAEKLEKAIKRKTEAEAPAQSRKAAEEPEPEEAPPSEPDPEPKTEHQAEPIKAGLPAIVPPQLPPATWDDLLTAMNNQHAIIDNVGGKTVIASWEPSSLDPTRLMVAFQNKESFLLRYSNRWATTEITNKRGATTQVEVQLSTWWLTHRHRRQYRGITFWPGKGKVVNECLNLWRDWGCEAREGDWSLIRHHIETVLAGGNAEFADYLIRWIAWSVQNPDKQAEVALVLIGVKGAGKGTLVRCLERIFGQHSFQVSSCESACKKDPLWG